MRILTKSKSVIPAIETLLLSTVYILIGPFEKTVSIIVIPAIEPLLLSTV